MQGMNAAQVITTGPDAGATGRSRRHRMLKTLLICSAAAGFWDPLHAQDAVSPDAATDVEADAKADRPDAPAATVPAPIAPRAVPKAKAPKRGSSDRFVNPAAETMVDETGQFFGMATFNGREITGSNNFRDISFRQFPTDLMRETTVRSGQTADQIEGAIYGLTTTESLRPLDLKKPRFQAEVRGIYSSYADRSHQDPGRRIQASYVDQFDTGIGRIGISVGAMLSNSFLPKDFYKATTAVRPCNSIDAGALAPVVTATGNCTYNPNSTNPTYIATGSHTFRQQRSDENQRAYFGALQWQPSDRLDINFDIQRSSRVQHRYRSEFSLTEGFRGIAPIEVTPGGALVKYAGQSALETLAFERTRDEKYTGGGLSIKYQATDRLSLSTDASYSHTTRLQTDRSASVASNDTFGPGGRVGYTIDFSHGDIPVVTFATPIDLNDYDAYTAGAAARRGRDTRADTIKAIRGDLVYDISGGFFDQIKAGIRYSTHKRTGTLLSFLTNNDIPMANVLAGNANCRRGPVTDNYLASAGSNINSWAVFDPVCLFSTFTGSTDPDKPLSTTTGGGIEIHEKILAGYLMGTFKTKLGAVPIDGNIGGRLIQTKRSSLVYRYTGTAPATEDSSGSIIDFLPSLNLNANIAPSLQAHASIDRTLLRSSFDGFGLRRVIAGPAGFIERERPLKSWNLGLSFDYAPTQDTSLELEFYYKFMSSAAWPGDVFIPGGPVLSPALRANADKKTWTRGFSVALNQTFSFLPAPFDGLSLQGSYAYSDTNFRFYDPSATDPLNPMYLFADPVGVPGLNKHVATAAARYEKDGFGFGASYEYQSGYFRPTGLTASRILGETGYINGYISYQLTQHVQMRLSGTNLGNEHEVLYRPIQDAVGQTSYFGRTFQFSVRLKY